MRLARRMAAVALLLVGLAVPGAAAALSLTGFKNSLVEFLLEQISIPGQFEVRAENIVEAEDGGTQLEGVTILDGKGVWFEARSFRLTWSPSRLLRGEVQIDTLALDGGRLNRLPDPGDAPAEPVEGTGDQGSDTVWPRSPIALRIVNLQITDMAVSQDVAPQRIAFDATGSLQDEGEEQSLTLNLTRTDAVDGAIDVSYAKRFDTGALRLKLSAQEAPGGIVAAALGLPDDVPASLTIDADGPPANWAGDLDLQVAGYIAADGAMTARWADRIGGDVDLDMVPGERLDETARLVIGERARLRATAEEDDAGRVRLRDTRLDGTAVTLSADGTIDRNSNAVDLAVDLAVAPEGAERLAPLMHPVTIEGGTATVQLTGTLGGSLTIAGDARTQGLAAAGFSADAAVLDFTAATDDAAQIVQLALTAQGPAGPTAKYDAIFGESAVISLDVRRQGETVTLAAFDVTTAAVSAGAKGTVRIGETIAPDLAYTVRAPDVAPLAALADLPATGAIDADGTVTGAVDDLRAAGTLALRDATVNGERIGRLDLAHEITRTREIAGDLSLTVAGSRLGDGRATATIIADDETMTLVALNADLLGLKARGEGTVPFSGAPPRADLAVEIATLSPIGRLAGIALGGRGKGTVVLRETGAGVANLDLALRDLTYDAISARRVALKGSVADYTATPDVDLTASLAQAQPAPDLRLDAAVAEASGTLNDLSIILTAAGTHQDRPLRADLAAAGDLAAAPQTVTLRRLDANYDDIPLRLRRPALITLDAPQVAVDQVDLTIATTGRLTGAMTYRPTAIEANLDLRDLPLNVARSFVDAPLAAGTVTARMRGTTGGPNAGLTARAVIDGFMLEHMAAQTIPAMNAEVDAVWNGREVNADGAVTGDFGAPMTFRATLPLRPGDGPVPVVPETAEIDAALTWSGEMESVFRLLPLPDHILTGAAEVDVRATGPLATPSVSGTLALTDGRYEFLTAGTVLSGLSLDTRFDEAQRIGFTLRANDGGAGTVSSEGSVAFQDDGLVIDIDTTARRAVLVRRDEATARISADLAVDGQPSGMDVAGTVNVDGAEIRLLSTLPPAAADIGPVEFADDESGEARGSGNGGDDDSPIRLDIAISMPSKIFVRGRGLDTEWGGALQVSGTAAQPVVTGRIGKRRGGLDFIGRYFELTKGDIVFDGGRKIDPTIEMQLFREAGDVTGGVKVSGRASAPEVAFASSPVLPEDEVLPRVLFGRSRQSLSPSEAVQLAAGIATLTSGKTSVMDQARAALGVDVLRVDQGEDGGSTISVGRYVAENVYVGAKQALEGQGTSAVVEIEVIDNVIVDADIGQTTDSSVGLSWRYDF